MSDPGESGYRLPDSTSAERSYTWHCNGGDVTDDPVERAEQFLLAVRHEETTGEFEREFAAYDSERLAARLDSDEARMAFWINLYNAGTQQLLETHREAYEKRKKFFSLPAVTVAGKELSLDDIEHRILRRSYSQLVLGYIRRPFRGEFFERHELTARDPRIHFALNCGAQSCPPIAAYTREEIDDQLDMATESYLDGIVEYFPDEEVVLVPKVMRWFRGDFGGRGGIVSFLQRFEFLPDDAYPRLAYVEWDWSLTPGKFVDGAIQQE